MKLSYSLVCIAGRHGCSWMEEKDVKENESRLLLCSFPKDLTFSRSATKFFPLAWKLHWTNTQRCKKLVWKGAPAVCTDVGDGCSWIEEKAAQTNELWLFFRAIRKSSIEGGPPPSFYPLAPFLRWTNMKRCKKFMKLSYSLVCIAGRHGCSWNEEKYVKTSELGELGWLLCSMPKTWHFLGPPSSFSACMKTALNKSAALQKVCFRVCIGCAQWLSGRLQLN